MMIPALRLRVMTLAISVMLCGCATTTVDHQAVADFISLMSSKHGFDKTALAESLAQADIKPDIITKISKPSEALPWYKYRKLFLTQQRMAAGVKFWREHEATLARVEQTYGVPATMIVAILGIETNYGSRTGSYRVLDALFTLAFAYPPRAPFFRSELENFLLLCRQEATEPSLPLGSYAGAMGMPQFMPSSYLNYAVDYNGDKKRDIWRDTEDVIASIGNYFARHGWQKGGQLASQICEPRLKTPQSPCLFKEDLRNIAVESENPKITTPLLLTEKAKTIALEQEDGKEIWAIFHNFHVITRYNKSPLYAMAAVQLSLALSNQINLSSYEPTHNDILFAAGQRLLE